jgi:hypothetical protein
MPLIVLLVGILALLGSCAELATGVDPAASYAATDCGVVARQRAADASVIGYDQALQARVARDSYAAYQSNRTH